jgi:hypothetical protein
LEVSSSYPPLVEVAKIMPAGKAVAPAISGRRAVILSILVKRTDAFSQLLEVEKQKSLALDIDFYNAVFLTAFVVWRVAPKWLR